MITPCALLILANLICLTLAQVSTATNYPVAGCSRCVWDCSQPDAIPTPSCTGSITGCAGCVTNNYNTDLPSLTGDATGNCSLAASELNVLFVPALSNEICADAMITQVNPIPAATSPGDAIPSATSINSQTTALIFLGPSDTSNKSPFEANQLVASASAAASTGESSSSSPNSGLSTGAKAGIAIGSVLGFLALGALAAFIFLWSRRRRGKSSVAEPPMLLEEQKPAPPKHIEPADVPPKSPARRGVEQEFNPYPGPETSG